MHDHRVIADGGNGGSKPTGALTVAEAVYHNSIAYTVVEIGKEAFKWCDEITEVTLPDSVKVLGESAFYFCDALTTVNLGNSLEIIGASAFAISGLTTVHLPASVATIGEEAFSQCNAFTGFTVDSGNLNFSAADGILYNPDKTKLIAYPGGKTETSFTIPGTVEIIGENAFELNNKLENIMIGDSVESVEDGAFSNCQNLTDITIGSNVETIGEEVFANCQKLETVTFATDAKLKSIGKGAFGYCGIENLDLPDSLETIGEYAFGYCDNLRSVTIGPSVSVIGNDAFYAVWELASLTIDESNQHYTAEKAVLYDKAKETLIRYLPAKGDTSFTVPSTVKTIEASAFYACDNLIDVTIPASVNTIGDDIFYWANAMESVTFLSNTPPTIGDSIFSRCDSLTSVYVPEGSVEAYKTALVNSNLSDYQSKIKPLEIPGTVTGQMHIGGTTVNDLTKNAVGTGWIWNAGTATLSLTSSYIVDNFIEIKCADSATVNLVYTGDVAIDGRISCNGDLNILGSGGTLTVTENSGISSAAISANGHLHISGGIVEASSSYEGAKVISTEGGITISGDAQVTATPTATNGSGLYNSGPIIINGGTVTSTGKGTGFAISAATKVTLSGGNVHLLSEAGNFVKPGLLRAGGRLTSNGLLNTLSIAAQPMDITVKENDITETLTTSATVENGTVDYQWYQAPWEEDFRSIQEIQGANHAEFAIPKDLTVQDGTKFFICKVGAEGMVPIFSRFAKISVIEKEAPIPDGGSGGGDGSSGGSGGSGVTPQPPSQVVDRQQTDKIIETAVKEGKAPVIAIGDKVKGAEISADQLLANRQQGNLITFTNQGQQLMLSPQLIQALGLRSGSNVAIDFAPSAQVVDRQTAANLTRVDMLNQQLLGQGRQIDLRVDGQSVGQMQQPLQVTVDLSQFNLTERQKSNFTGVRYDENGKIAQQLGGEFSADGKTFTYYTYNAGEHSVIISGNLKKLQLQIGGKDYLANGESRVNDVAPVVVEDRALLPLRSIAEALDAGVEWNGETKTVSITKNGKMIHLTIGEQLPGGMGAAAIIDNRTFVPVRYIAEQLGANVVWEEETKQIAIYQ